MRKVRVFEKRIRADVLNRRQQPFVGYNWVGTF
jgi:hypothetical protein